jgi:hypothetical protein
MRQGKSRCDLPGFFFFLVVVLLVIVVFVVLVSVVVIILVFVIGVVVIEAEEGHEAVSGGAGFTFSRFGGGYVDQKCRPHLGQTQN